MPARNQFRHQTYSAALTLPPERVVVCKHPPPEPVGSAEFDEQLAAAGDAYRRAGVRYLYLLHGTFVGNDALGLFGEVARFFPEVGEAMRAISKRASDSLLGEAGNYTAAFAKQLEDGLRRADFQVRPTQTSTPTRTDLEVRPTRDIEVRRFHWSSENHHIARADGAIALLDELSQLELHDGERILIWGHSHAASLLALMTNLLVAEADDRRRFFRACRSYYRWPKLRRIDLSRWPRVREMLSRREHPLLTTPLDIATFGAPVRYGWDTDGCAQLIHFMHHNRDEPQATFPPSGEALLHGHCDFVQQLGIVGTDFPPGPFSWRSWLADMRLAKLLAPDLPRHGVLSRLRHGHRLHADGQNLLIDYGPQTGTIAQHLFGHAVYTRQSWLGFHAQQVAQAFYTESLGPGADAPG